MLCACTMHMPLVINQAANHMFAARLALARPRLDARCARAFRAGRPAQGGSAADMAKEFVTGADSSTGLSHLYHKLNWAICGLTPLALLLSPSAVNLPVDLALGVGIPVHFQISGHMLVTDYSPLLLGALGKTAGVQNALRLAVTATTAITVVGLAKLNLQGPGLTETIKSVWRKPSAE